jgi:glycosyltransferase involved in cell wall biosynthesis
MLAVAASDSTRQKKGDAARARYESELTPEVTTDSLLKIYAELQAR